MKNEARHATQLPPQARAASGDVRKDRGRYRCRSRACLPDVQKVKRIREQQHRISLREARK